MMMPVCLGQAGSDGDRLGRSVPLPSGRCSRLAVHAGSWYLQLPREPCSSAGSTSVPPGTTSRGDDPTWSLADDRPLVLLHSPSGRGSDRAGAGGAYVPSAPASGDHLTARIWAIPLPRGPRAGKMGQRHWYRNVPGDGSRRSSRGPQILDRVLADKGVILHDPLADLRGAALAPPAHPADGDAKAIKRHDVILLGVSDLRPSTGEACCTGCASLSPTLLREPASHQVLRCGPSRRRARGTESYCGWRCRSLEHPRIATGSVTPTVSERVVRYTFQGGTPRRSTSPPRPQSTASW